MIIAFSFDTNSTVRTSNLQCPDNWGNSCFYSISIEQMSVDVDNSAAFGDNTTDSTEGSVWLCLFHGTAGTAAKECPNGDAPIVYSSNWIAKFSVE